MACVMAAWVSLSRRCATLLYYVAWLALGMFVGTHHIVILLSTTADRRAERCWALVHCLMYVVSVFMLLGGGAWCTSPGAATSCSAAYGVSMSRHCLLELQTPEYRAIYIMHFVGLAWLACAWIGDGLQLWHWAACRPQPARLLWSPYSVASPLYVLHLCVTTVCVTITWTVVVDWSTAGTETLRLGGIIIAEILIITAITAAALNFFGRLVAPRAPPSAHGEKNSRVAEASAAAV